MKWIRQTVKESRKQRWFALVRIIGLSFCALNCVAQGYQDAPTKPRDGKLRPKARDSVTVTAKVTPEETEDGKINDAYQPVFVLEQRGNCETAIRRYESEVIPLAQRSKFEIPKNKFLFLANRGIGNCYMAQRRYQEAERRFSQIMEYLPIWPGTDDSDYPINFRQIATAQMGQQRWEAAEDSLKKSVSLFDTEIEKALTSDDEFWRTEHAGNLIGSKARSLAYLGIVYLREERKSEALKTAEIAYNAVTKPHVPSSFLSEVVQVGLSIATACGDENAISQWSLRSAKQN
jgi:tetratricopeptide (TPR) repeat protein